VRRRGGGEERRGEERREGERFTLDEPRVFFNTAVVCSCADTSSKFFGRLDSHSLLRQLQVREMRGKIV